ncbi:MAG: family 1 glycosylhydrolase [Chthoniobacterales bacterium]|nr:family 1 glycosylhydrolase [Chthoniobacterales bacterium]
MKRTIFWLSLALITVCFSSCVTPPSAYHCSVKGTALKPVPKQTFWWGVSTAPFQNEDRGYPKDSPWYFKTDWDRYAEEGVVPLRGDEAVFSWSEFDRDLQALQQLGVNHFRFGVEWARIEPRPGIINHQALAQYVTMARKLKAAGIEPIVTLWHFTFPDWLYKTHDKAHSNFCHPDVEAAWHAHVQRVAHAMAPYVKIYVPQNEPNGALQLGWIAGHWPPGLLLHPFSYKKAMKTAAAMFRDAAATLRKERPDAIVMGIYSLPECTRSFTHDPTALIYNIYQRQNYDHLDMVADTCDIIGVNYYYSKSSSIHELLLRSGGERSSLYTQMGWEINPEGLYRVLCSVNDRYHKPIVISENGIATQSAQKAIAFFRNHIAQMRRAINDGVDVRGYFPWTLVDNYEWTEGWKGQFGLFFYDKKTHERHITPAGIWFSKFIKAYPEP